MKINNESKSTTPLFGLTCMGQDSKIATYRELKHSCRRISVQTIICNHPNECFNFY